MEKSYFFKDIVNFEKSSDEEDGIPKGCIEEFEEKICPECPYFSVEMVGHPGGSGVHSVEKMTCELFWKDEF